MRGRGVAGVETTELDIGGVITGAIKVIQANPVNLLIVASAAALPGVINGLADVPDSAGVVWWGSRAVGLFVGAAETAALIWLSAEALAGRQSTALDALRSCLGLIPALAVVTLLQTLAFAVGSAVFFVPGLIALTMWCLAAPFIVLGPAKILESFGLSARLTKTQRWRVFLLLVIYGVPVLALSLGPVLVAMRGGRSPAEAAQNLWWLAVARGVVFSILSNVGLTVLYADLRKLKDGGDVGALAKVFD